MGQRLGRALVFFCKNRNIDPILVIGRDTRASGEALERAVVSGAGSVGGQIYDLGEMPTPGVAFLTRDLGAGVGVVISASHNPYEYNGFKVFTGEGLKLSLEEESELETLILASPASSEKEDPSFAKVVEDASERYIAFLKKTFPEDLSLKGLKIVLDCANGATHKIAPTLFKRLETDVSTLFSQPDGENINKDCGSEHPESLA